jgi:hypothetical protein
MADNIPVTAGAGTTVAADDIAGVFHQRIKMTLGADGVSDGDVSNSNPIPTKTEVANTGTITSLANAVASAVVLAANANRKSAIIHNDSSTTVYLAFAPTASSTAFTVRLTSQATYILNFGVKYTGVISRAAAAANGDLRITELT